MRALLAPSERAASTNSFSRSESVVERTMRAMYGQVKAEITKITSDEPGLHEAVQAAVRATPQEAAMPIASSSCGSASTTSLMRETIVSTKPR